jgi:hypothetical protein
MLSVLLIFVFSLSFLAIGQGPLRIGASVALLASLVPLFFVRKWPRFLEHIDHVSTATTMQRPPLISDHCGILRGPR